MIIAFQNERFRKKSQYRDRKHQMIRLYIKNQGVMIGVILRTLFQECLLSASYLFAV